MFSTKVFSVLSMGLAITAASFLSPAIGRCQSEPKPAVVISIAEMGEQLKDIDYLANACGDPIGQMSGMVKMQVQGFLNGIDKTKPAGALLFFDQGPEPSYLGFVPVTNLDDVLDTLSRFSEIDEGDDYITIIPQNGKEVVVKEIGGYAFFAEDPDMLDRAPEDPARLIGEMGQSYNLAAQLFPNRIPESLRQQALDMIRQGMDQQLETLDDDEPELAEMQRKNAELQMAQLESLFNETEELVIGFAADQEAQSLHFDIEMSTQDGSIMARRIDAARNAGASDFSGFLMDGAAFSGNSINQLIDEDVQQYTGLLEGFQAAIEKKIDEQGDDLKDHADELKEVVTSLFEAVEATIEGGRLDMGVVVSTDNDALNLAAGFHVVDPSKIEQAIKKVVTAVEEEDTKDILTVEMNAVSHQGVKFHKIAVAIPEDKEEARQVFGEQLVVLMGIGKDSVYVGLGRDPMDLLTSAMDKSESSDSANPLAAEWNLFLGPLLKFASQMDGGQMVAGLADALEKSGRDRIQITSGFTGDHGMKMRMDIQDGILSLVGQRLQMQMQMQGGPPAADF